jgi:pilus assembly protein CpaC
LGALIAFMALTPILPAPAADGPQKSAIKVAASEGTSRSIPLGIGKSVAIDLPADIKDVLVADPKIANAVVRSSRRVYMIGVAVGQTNIFFFDADGKQIAGFDIAVTRDLNGLRAALKQSMPDSDIHIEVSERTVSCFPARQPAPPNPSMLTTWLRGWSVMGRRS